MSHGKMQSVSRANRKLPPSTDPLGETLHLLRLTGTLYCRAELTAPWGVALPPFEGCMMFHVVTAGRGWLEVEGAATRRRDRHHSAGRHPRHPDDPLVDGAIDVTTVRRIISGGQTGVDRAALDVALERGIPCGGWCPKGRRAEDGAIPRRYPLRETDSTHYVERTERNVLEADATLVLNLGALSGGTAETVDLARRHRRAWLVVDPTEPSAARRVREWLAAQAVEVLNVAGSRERERPGIHEQALGLLRDLFAAP